MDKNRFNINNYMENTLVLKSINELLGYDFYISSYQRGYRWIDTQVEQLLDDIWKFSEKEKTRGEFYCLQPIVVKKYNDKWEVIDGQQRLTTLHIIFKYFEDLYKMIDSNFKSYTIEYARRESAPLSIDDIKTDNLLLSDDIDYFFMREAYKTVEKWFESSKAKKLDFINTLLKHNVDSKIDIANNVRVIWYELKEEDNVDPIDVFDRLNKGKIPLTNAELIKALILQKGNFANGEQFLKQVQISTEWNNIEKALQNDAFWYFIYNSSNPIKYENRIEYIFDLMKSKTKECEMYYTFNEFRKSFEVERLSVDNLWMDVKNFFLSLDEWYNDNVLFHYIGYLIECGIPISQIMEESSKQNKNDFQQKYLIGEIRKLVRCDIESISYGDKSIKRILLLFNLQTILETQKSDMRFPFHKYKSESWDIEHVVSQTDKNIPESKYTEWAIDIIEFFVGSSNKDDIDNYIQNGDNNQERVELIKKIIPLIDSSNKDRDLFDECFSLLGKYFAEAGQVDEKNDISNLALLDSKTNRSYGNAFFPIKRQRVIANDRHGIFVPIATKNLFLKYYSTQGADNMYWRESDAKDYLSAIKQVLKQFLPKEQ